MGWKKEEKAHFRPWIENKTIKQPFTSNSQGTFCVLCEMKTITIATLLLLAVGVTACLESGLDATTTLSDNDFDYLDSTGDLTDYTNDPYRLFAITPSGETLKIIVEYSGGCSSHNFATLWDGNTAAEEARIYLLHNGNGDLCEAYLRDTVEVNIANIITSDIYRAGRTLVFINASNDREIKIDPKMAAISQGGECTHNASLLGTSCGNGVWDNQWLLLQEEVPDHDKVWLQPIANTTNVALRKPETGNYLVGITLLFGYDQLDQQCQDGPDGSVIPVSINCLEKN